MEPSWDVFISYATSDSAVVAPIQKEIENHGLTVWRDKSSIRLGERLRAAINNGIRRSRSIVVFISRRSLASPWVLNELDAAMLREVRERRTVVIPVLIGRVESDDLPADLQGKLHFDLRNGWKKQWMRERGRFLAALTAAAREAQPEEPPEFPFGEELVGRLLGHRFSREAEADDAVSLAEVFAEKFVEVYDKARHPQDRALIRQLVDRYGRYGLRHIFLYWIDVTQLDPRGFTSEDMKVVFDNTLMTVALLGGSDDWAAQGIKLTAQIPDGDEMQVRIERIEDGQERTRPQSSCPGSDGP
ncbi:MAG TPA: toll/interleukin-1 receptor domain-containing protein [Solirubrobacteraceae bacterium]|jgi:hypothetical protein|nr:toll/interleukin-1 receptor domain-containing protein [Solirubrobacteraceae bacterium]